MEGAISSGWAGRFIGTDAPKWATSAGVLSATLRGVETGPGAGRDPRHYQIAGLEPGVLNGGGARNEVCFQP